MKVEDVIALLKEMPQKSEMVFKGYACGQDFLQKVEPTDFLVSEEKEEVIILADWN